MLRVPNRNQHVQGEKEDDALWIKFLKTLPGFLVAYGRYIIGVTIIAYLDL